MSSARFRSDALASLTDSANWLMRRLKPPTKSIASPQQIPELLPEIPRPAEPSYQRGESRSVRTEDAHAVAVVAMATAATDRVLPPPGRERIPDIGAAANLCTELAQVIEPDEVRHLLQRLAELLGAVGIVVWLSDRTGQKLTPAMTYGYPESVIARISNVQRTAQNPTAAAFRSAQPEIVTGTGTGNGAIAIPLVTPGGCAGVLAAEIRHGGEQSEWVPALARIFAAQLAMLIALPSTESRRAHA